MNSWSYSQYSTAVDCLRKYKLIYIDKLASEQPPSGDMAFGSAIHSAINGILTGEDGEALFTIYWESYREKELKYTRYRWNDLNYLGFNLLRKFKRLHAGKYEIDRTISEVRLYGEYKGIKFEGTPDFYGKYDGRRSLRDFKTSGYNYDKDKNKVALQLYLYGFLYYSKSGTMPETVGYTVFNKGTGSIQDLTWEFKEEDMYKHLDSMVEYVKMFSNGDIGVGWPKNPNACIKGSMKCDYFEHCWGKR